MKKFLDKDFLLNTKTAKKIFHDYAKDMPIIDYHCHINPKEIAEDKHYDSITQVWLYGDHYKWRAMRNCGVEEKYITGNATDYEKFEKWAEIIPSLIGNPLYHWTHLELKAYFGYDGVLNKNTAKKVWDICNKKLEKLSVKKIIKISNVEVICTTDDPADTLEYHKLIAKDSDFDVKVVPAFRPDKAINIDKDDYDQYLITLSEAADEKIASFSDLKKCLINRMDFFNMSGCKVSDHACEYIVYSEADEREIKNIFQKRMQGNVLNQEEIYKFKTAMILFLAAEYEKRNWIMQIHYGALRNVNAKMFNILGPDTGYDCILTRDSSQGLAMMFDKLESKSALPKTIIYSLNPNDDAMITSVIGCFQEEGIKSKIQHGSAWWYNDTKMGMLNHLKNLASISVLGNFVGMLTDSRSFLSYTRHEYFRRILCNMIGDLVEDGEYPYDEVQIKNITEDICYYNAKHYFEF